MLADTLLQSRGGEEAAKAYEEAEELVQQLKPYLWVQTELRPDRWKSLATLIYHFCDFLLAQGRASDVVWCAQRAIGPARASRLVLPVALNLVYLGRALTVAAGAGDACSRTPHQRLRHPFGSGSRSELVPWLLGSRPDERPLIEANDLSGNAGDVLAEAVDGLRRAGKEQFLPVGLLARAAFFRCTRDFDGARRDLIEADAVAVRGDMARWQIDCHLEHARLLIAQLPRQATRGSLLAAEPDRYSPEQQVRYRDRNLLRQSAKAHCRDRFAAPRARVDSDPRMSRWRDCCGAS